MLGKREALVIYQGLLYITEAWARSIQKLIVRNGRRNALETVVL
jgi:hypothetical protein